MVLKLITGFVALLMAALQTHQLLSRSLADEWKAHDPGVATRAFLDAHRPHSWTVQGLREFANLQAATDIDAAIAATHEALLWEPADPYIWSRLVVLYLYDQPMRIAPALLAAQTAGFLAPHTVPVHIEQALLAARFHGRTDPELDAIWTDSLGIAQHDKFRFARLAVATSSELALCELISEHAPLGPWCLNAEARRLRCTSHPQLLSERRRKACSDAGFSVPEP